MARHIQLRTKQRKAKMMIRRHSALLKQKYSDAKKAVDRQNKIESMLLVREQKQDEKAANALLFHATKREKLQDQILKIAVKFEMMQKLRKNASMGTWKRCIDAIGHEFKSRLVKGDAGVYLASSHTSGMCQKAGLRYLRISKLLNAWQKQKYKHMKELDVTKNAMKRMGQRCAQTPFHVRSNQLWRKTRNFYCTKYTSIRKVAIDKLKRENRELEASLKKVKSISGNGSHAATNQAWKALSGFFSDAVNRYTNTVKSFGQVVKAGLEAIWKAVKAATRVISAAIATILNSTFSALHSTFSSTLKRLTPGFEYMVALPSKPNIKPIAHIRAHSAPLPQRILSPSLYFCSPLRRIYDLMPVTRSVHVIRILLLLTRSPPQTFASIYIKATFRHWMPLHTPHNTRSFCSHVR